ncbi:hypothetical protein AMS68_001091 [Peltaster fructicola]|uniref:NADH:flavin oxidoreductase/NADH oxidase N-terminal domain-containing protein n=1 Tax=Peltaster fructicola TaxID=286661 RepID=A0A6H0XLG6_9PEZI|nr:hypothetical protein AMS68_001091 [Peltaster fructicola]
MADRLFQPIQLGDIKLGHRMAMAPLTRFRANDDHVHQPIAVEYYEQRASTPGTLLISEATFISAQAGGYYNVPGIYNEDQIKAWKAVTDAVHKKGSYIYAQLWALGRVANPKALEKDGFKLVSSSDVPVAEGAQAPQPLTEAEIKQYVADYATAASNAIKAGFDGVEIHAANGYLPDQFTSANSNKRTDKYGGSVEKRSTFALEVADAVAKAIGSQKVGIRLSPWSPFQGMDSKDPVPQFSHLISELKKFNLAYLHLVESRSSGDVAVATYQSVTNANDKFLQLWGSAPVVLAGGFTPEKAKKSVGEVYTGDNIIIAFGRSFISTPDLPYRIKNGIELNKYDRSTFYSRKDPKGYIDQPFSKEWEAAQSRL